MLKLLLLQAVPALRLHGHDDDDAYDGCDAGLAENEANCTFVPSINPASERLLEDSTNLPADFQARQRFFAQQRKAHLQRIANQSVSCCLIPR